MVNAEQAVDTLKARLENVEEVDQKVLRGVKRYRGLPYAVFYADISGNVERRAEDLEQFQDRVLGQKYFEEKYDLRWNSYLLFLAERNRFSENSFQHARRILEADRNYARKFVIPEDDLASCLDSRLPMQAVQPTETPDIIDRWKALLSGGGLDAVLDDDEIASIVRAILNGPSRPKPPKNNRIVRSQDDGVGSSFLRQIDIKSFRTHPVTNKFDFGLVNLICGVNGAGKTSLLEAIEFFYCGRNLRSDSPKAARVAVTLHGAQRTVETSSSTRLPTFRDRHLRWYGKLDLKRNLMPGSFARFNFLNTDAAFHLSTENDPSRLREDLATLLVGADAARIWGRLERVHRELRPEIRALGKELHALADQVKVQTERLANARNVLRTSDEVFGLLKGYLAQIKWSRIPDSKEAAADKNQCNLIQVESVLGLTTELNDLPTDLTMDSVRTALHTSQRFLDRANELSRRFSAAESRRYNLESTLKQCVATEDDLWELDRYMTTGYSDLTTTADRYRAEVMAVTVKIGGLDTSQPVSDVIISSPLPLQQLYVQVLQHAEELDSAARVAGNLFEAFKQEQDRALSLAQELRAIADQVLKDSENQDICPLCHTPFSPGELRTHILVELDSVREIRARELWQTVEAAQRRSADARQIVNQVEALLQYCQRGKVDEYSVRSSQVLEDLTMATRDLARIKHEFDQVQLRLQALESNGLNRQRLFLLTARLFPEPTESPSRESIAAGIALNAMEVTRIKGEIVQVDEESKQIKEMLDQLLGDAGIKIGTDINGAVNTLQRRVNNLSMASDSIDGIGDALILEEKTSLVRLLSGLRTASTAQDQLGQALALEARADKSVVEANEALNKAKQNENRTRKTRNRVQEAGKILEEILEKHSLDSVTRDLLEANRTQVAHIFSRIHSPHEFEVITTNDGFLRRIETKIPIKLNEVSTGQRAAFALSIFLAMNTYAQKAPPIMLIDDPVAHVDDLNTLSFLDYLRDMAVAGDRQIFFATADDKLAGLFKHKFSFLGSEFKTHLLMRD